MNKRIISFLLTLLMIFSLLPMAAFADEETVETEEETTTIEETTEEVSTEEESEEEATVEEETTAEEEITADETVAESSVSLDGAVTEFKAVTGNVTISGSDVKASGTFTLPAPEGDIFCRYGFEWGLAPYQPLGEAMEVASDERDGRVLELSLTDYLWNAVMVSGVTYYYWAVIYCADGTVTGDAKPFTAPTLTYETISVGGSKTVGEWERGQYSFTPTADGIYQLNSGGGGWRVVCDSTGAIVKEGSDTVTFTAKANQTYYIAFANTGGDDLTVTLSKFVPTVTERKAVTGDVSVSGTSVNADGTFTMPYSEKPYAVDGTIYIYGFEWGLERGESIGYVMWGGSEEQNGQALEADLTEYLGSAVMVPGVDYCCWAVIYYAGGVALGEAKLFTAPNLTYETISAGNSKTIEAWDAGQYRFQPTEDGRYKLGFDGDGLVQVFDSTGAVVKLGNSGFTFEAKAGQTYYIGAESYNDTSYTLTLSKFVPTVTEVKAETGEYEISADGTVTIYGYFTFPMSELGHDIDFAIGTETEPFYYGSGGNMSEEELDHEKYEIDLSYWLLIPGVTYYYRAYTYDDDYEIVMGDAKSFVAPDHEFETLAAGETKTLTVWESGYYRFEPVEDGTYQWSAVGEGSVTVYDSTGVIVWESDLLDVDEETGYPTWSLDGESFEAKTGKTYYVWVNNYSDTELLTVKLTKSGTTGGETTGDVLTALGDIASDAKADEIRAAVQEIDKGDLAEALSGENSAAVIEKLAKLESKVSGKVTVDVLDGAGVSGASIVGAALNNVTGDVKLTIRAASAEKDVPAGLDASKAICLDMKLDGVENPSDLKVPVCITIAVPKSIQWELVRLVHHGEKGDEILSPVAYGEGGAMFVVGGFSPFTLTEVAHKAGDVDGNGTANILDVLTLLKYVAGITDDIVYSDVNNSGKTDIHDVLALLKFVAKIEGITVL